MAKKATGLAAFTRPKAGAEATSLAAIEDDRPAVEIPTPRRRGEGARLSRLRSRSGDRTGSAFASSRMQRERQFRRWPRPGFRRFWHSTDCRRSSLMHVDT